MSTDAWGAVLTGISCEAGWLMLEPATQAAGVAVQGDCPYCRLLRYWIPGRKWAPSLARLMQMAL
jgi:hypothetical protein